jgi:hypothetical protein
LLVGFDFDRASTAENPIIWVTSSYFAFTDVPDFTGKVTRMSGANLETVEDAVINLPRSIKDHQTMQPSFGPDGALYFSQASQTAMGAPDHDWGMRKEHMLNACILRLDTTKLSPGKPLDARTIDCGGDYDPAAPDAPLTIYATGVRLGYDLVWHSNGHLYVPTNGSDKGGNVPKGDKSPSLYDLPIPKTTGFSASRRASITDIPIRFSANLCSTAGIQPPSGIPVRSFNIPSARSRIRNWQKPAWNLGRHISANGAIEYKSDAFGGSSRASF